MFEDVCLFCSRPVEPNEVYCSDECRLSDFSASTSPSLSVSGSSREREARRPDERTAHAGPYQRHTHGRQRSSISSSSMSSGSALCTPGVLPLPDDSPELPDLSDIEADELTIPKSLRMDQFLDPNQNAKKVKSFGLMFARRPSATNSRSTIPVPLPIGSADSHPRHRPRLGEVHVRTHSVPVNFFACGSDYETDEPESSAKDTDHDDYPTHESRGALSTSSAHRASRSSRHSASSKLSNFPLHSPGYASSPLNDSRKSRRTRHDSQATLTGISASGHGTLKPKRVSLPAAGFASLLQVGQEVGMRTRAKGYGQCNTAHALLGASLPVADAGRPRGHARRQTAGDIKRFSPTALDLHKVSTGLAQWKAQVGGDRVNRSRSPSRSGGRKSSTQFRDWQPNVLDKEVPRGRPNLPGGRYFTDSAVHRIKAQESLASTEPLAGLNGFGIYRHEVDQDADRPRGRTESRGRPRQRWETQDSRLNDLQDPRSQDRGRRRERTVAVGQLH